MKKLLIAVVVLITVGCLWQVAGQHYFPTEYIADNSLRGGRFWKGRSSYDVGPTAPLIPAQAPGPADRWGGGDIKSINFQVPYSRTASFYLSLFETHQSAPPLIEVLVNGAKLKNIQTRAGTGKGFPAWVSTGRSSDYRVEIPGKMLDREKNIVTLRMVSGSWMAIQKVVLRPQASWWAYALALIGLVLLAGMYLRRVIAGKLWKEHALNAFLLLFCSILALGAAEVILRWFFPQQEYVPDLRIVYIPDSETGFVLKPNVKTNLGFNTNRLGMRDYDRYTQVKPAGVYRIICLGDSFTFSLTAMEDSWPKDLERLLAPKGSQSKIQVLNAGVMGYGTDNAYHYLKKHILELGPDLVLLGFYVGNDITDNYEHPSNTAVDGVMVRIKDAEKYTKKEISWEKKKRAFLNQFHLVRLIQNRSFKGLFQAMDLRSKNTREKMNLVSGRCVRATGLKVHRSPQSFGPIIKESWDKTLSCLDDLYKLAHDKGFKLGFILLPDAIQFDTEEVKAMKTKLGGGYDWDQPQKSLMDMAQKRGWSMLNALPAMKAQWDGSLIYYCQDTHFNEQGNRLLARIIRQWLDSKYPEISVTSQ